MANLHNRISRKELKGRIANDNTPRTTISFYNYIPIPDPQQFRDEMYRHYLEMGVLGRIYVAHEGINAQISVPTANLENVKEYLYALPGFEGLRLNIAVDDNGRSFFVLDVKVRKKIVADGIEDPGFDMGRKGKYVNAEQFNKLTEDPNTIIIDMRNHYEYEVGHFKNAIEVPSDTFREQLPMAVDMMKDRKDATIIMYCTGGIRCEKASAYMLHQGFSNVFHVEGGIINYSRQAEALGLENKFIGKNFVFDERLGERISNDIIARCHQCGKPADTHVNCVNEGCHLLFIQCDECAEKFDKCCSTACQEIIHLPEETQKELRKGQDKGQNIFNKSRKRKTVFK
jgi:UPF0176 protein